MYQNQPLSKAQDKMLPEFGSGQALAAFEVAEERQAAEELRVLPCRSGVLVDAALVARGVYHVLRVDGAFVAVGVCVGHAADPVAVVDHAGDGVLLADVHADVACVVEQDLVELAPLDLVGVGRLAGHLR